MVYPWLHELAQRERAPVAAAAVAAPQFQMFGQLFYCIDPRCGEPVYGQLPYKRHRVCGGAVGQRNGAAVVARLQHDAQRAYNRGMRQLLICETHTDCAWCQQQGIIHPSVIWGNFLNWCQNVPNSVPVQMVRKVETGAVSLVGPDKVLDIRELLVSGADCSPLYLGQRLDRAGFAGQDVIHDLTCLIQGNVEYLRQRAERAPAPTPVRGIVVGSGLPGGPSHFSISDRIEVLPDALALATGRLLAWRLTEAPVVVVIPHNPAKPHGVEHTRQNLQRLHRTVTGILARFDRAGRFPVLPVLATKGTGDLTPVTI